MIRRLGRRLDPVENLIVRRLRRTRAPARVTCMAAIAGAVMIARAIRIARTVNLGIDRLGQEVELDRWRLPRIGRA